MDTGAGDLRRGPPWCTLAVETPCHASPTQTKGTGQARIRPGVGSKVMAAACLSRRLSDSSPANAGLLHGIWHKFWSQLAAHGGLFNLPRGHTPVHPGSDRTGAEAAMASWLVTHID